MDCRVISPRISEPVSNDLPCTGKYDFLKAKTRQPPGQIDEFDPDCNKHLLFADQSHRLTI